MRDILRVILELIIIKLISIDLNIRADIFQTVSIFVLIEIRLVIIVRIVGDLV